MSNAELVKQAGSLIGNGRKFAAALREAARHLKSAAAARATLAVTADGESYNVRSTVIADAAPPHETNEEYASLEQNPSLFNFSIGALRPLKKSVPHLCMSLSRPPPSLSPLLHKPFLLSAPSPSFSLQQRGRCQPRQSRFDTISSKTHSPPPSLSLPLLLWRCVGLFHTF